MIDELDFKDDMALIVNYFPTLSMIIIALSILFLLFVAGVALAMKGAHTLDYADVYLNQTEAGTLAKSHRDKEYSEAA